MRVINFFIRWEAPTLNKIWAGMHWSQRKRIADQGHQAVARAVSGSVDPITGPVEILVQPILGPRKRGYDCSNYAVALKVVEDGLVRAGLLADDSGKHVALVAVARPERGDETGLKITVTEIN